MLSAESEIKSGFKDWHRLGMGRAAHPLSGLFSVFEIGVTMASRF